MADPIAFLLNHGASIVFVMTFAARLGVPLPAAPLLVVAGGLAGGGSFPLASTFLLSLIANLAGDALWFWSGRHWGHRVLRLLCRISLSPDSCVRQSESLILRWGGHSLIAAKFVPGVSVVAAPLAGALGMSWARFAAFDLLAGAAWTSVFIGLGWLFSSEIERVLQILSGSGIVAAVLLLLVVVALLGARWWRRRRFLREVGIPRIGVDELRALLRDGAQPIVIDVRPRGSLRSDPRCIPGALAVELDDIAALAATLPADREVVVYCNCPNEASAARAAVTLARLGVQRARPLAGGLDAWEAAVEAARARPDIAAGRHEPA